MNAAVPCLLGLLLSAPEAQTRPPLQISVIERPSGRLVGFAEVVIYAPNGTAIRRGETGLYGNPFNAEAVERLDPALKELCVVVRKLRGYDYVTESMTLSFQENAWRPKIKTPQPPNLQSERLTQVAYQDIANQIPALPGSPEQTGVVEVWLRLPPIPVCRSAPWQAFVCGYVPFAPPGPPCGYRPPPPPGVAWQPSSIRPSTVSVPAELEAKIQREAAIAELGRPPAPERHWAPYGGRWVQGPYGMFWLGRAIPPQAQQPQKPETGTNRGTGSVQGY